MIQYSPALRSGAVRASSRHPGILDAPPSRIGAKLASCGLRFFTSPRLRGEVGFCSSTPPRWGGEGGFWAERGGLKESGGGGLSTFSVRGESPSPGSQLAL